MYKEVHFFPKSVIKNIVVPLTGLYLPVVCELFHNSDHHIIWQNYNHIGYTYTYVYITTLTYVCICKEFS